MRSVEKSAKTREEALEAALQELNASIADVDVQVLEEGSKGLFGLFGSRPYRLRVTLRGQESREDELDVMSLLNDKKEPAKPAPEPEKPARAEKPERAPRPEKAEAAEETAEDKPARPRRPEPVRRVNPDRKPAQEKPAEETALAAEDAELPEEEAADVPAGEETQEVKRKRRRHRSRGKKKPAAAPAEGEEAAEDAEEAPAPKLPPKKPVKPIEKPVVTLIEDAELAADSPAGEAKAFLQELTTLMGVPVSIRMGTDEEGNVFGYMEGDTLGILIGRRGETLDAIQYLTSLRINKGRDKYTRVTLDTENYRAKREDTLVRLANRKANHALKTGRRVSLEPMNPYERRIVHSALQANELIDTHSEGEEPNRHVVITVRKA